MAIIGQALKKIRSEKGITQIELSLKTGIPQSHISNIEKGIEPELPTLRKICDALDINPLVFVFKAFNEIDFDSHLDIPIEKYDNAIKTVRDELLN